MWSNIDSLIMLWYSLLPQIYILLGIYDKVSYYYYYNSANYQIYDKLLLY